MSFSRGLLRLSVTAASCLSTVALAQQPGSSAVLSGRVISGGAPVQGVEVTVEAISWFITTDSAGRFRLTGLTPGRHQVRLRRLGFAPSRDTVTLSPGAETERTYSLEPIATQLDTVRTNSDQVSYQTPRLQEFEARRKRNVGGQFISEADLRKDENASMPSILRRVPGLNIVQYNGQSFVRTRGAGTVKGDPPLNPRPGAPTGCWATIYLDGTLIFDVSMMGTGVGTVTPPDVGQIFALNLSGVEYYSSAGSTPLQYKPARSNCGTLLFWTRGR